MKKKLIIMIGITILIIIIILGLLITMSGLADINNDTVLEQQKESAEPIQSMVKPVSENVEFFTVQSYIQEFIEQINMNNPVYYTGGERIDQSIIAKWTYSLLSQEYIDKNAITEENVYEYVDNIEESLIFVPLKMNEIKLENTTKYAIYGFTQTVNNEYREDLYFILNVDNNNNTYSIEPLKNIRSIEEIELNNNNLEIEKNRYNTYKEKKITDEYICEQYLYIYKRLMLAKTQEAYNYLNEEYRDKKFDSLQDYTDYVTNNKDKIAQIALNAYSINDNRYICRDQWNNYYIFNVNGVFAYNVMLDIYTVDVKEFTEKYNSSSNENKVAMNVEKIESAINNRDYKFIYNKLDETFKNNNFKSLDEFAEYINKNFFDNNNLEYESISNEGNVYIYTIKLTDVNNEENTKTMTIIMKLKEGTDFVMSFSIE